MDLKIIKQWISQKNTSAIEDAWMEAMVGKTRPHKFRAVLDALNERKMSDLAESLGTMLASETLEQKTGLDALVVLRQVLPAITGNQELRDKTAEVYKQEYGQQEFFSDFLQASGLKAKQSLRRAIRTLDTCLSIKPDMYMANRFDHQVVQVKQYDDVMEQFELVAPGGKVLELDPKLLADEFEAVEDTDFRVLSKFRKDDLTKLLKNDPGSVLIGICVAHGGQISAMDLKDLLVGKYMESGKWSSWWSRARSAAKKCEQLTIEGRNPAMVVYHPHGQSLEEELAGAVSKARVPADHLGILRDYARELKHRGLEGDAEFVAPIVSTLIQQAREFQVRRPVDALTAALAVEEAVLQGLPVGEGETHSAEDIVKSLKNPIKVICDLPDTSLWAAALEVLAQREDAAQCFEKLLTIMPPSQTDAIVRNLRKAERGEVVTQAIENMLVDPAPYAQVALWLWQGPGEEVENAPSMLDLLSRLLKVMEDLSRDADVEHSERKELHQQIRSALTASDCASFRKALAEMDEGVAATIKRRIERSHGLSDTVRDSLLALIREEHYGLFLKAKVVPWLDESVLWATQESIDRQNAALKEILEIKMPENSRAIGKAAALGDLRENAEWQYAVEEQRRLQAQAAQLQADLQRVRVIEFEDVPGDSIAIGSKVILKRVDGGQENEVNILGPWESDLTKKIYNYKTPMALEILGKKAGETVMLKLEGDECEYLIESTTPMTA